MSITPSETPASRLTNSVTLKSIIVIILTLLLLIPSAMIRSIIAEREHLNIATVQDVSAKWAGRQVLSGPVLTIPLVYTYEHDEKVTYTTSYWHILPEELEISGSLDPQTLHRGIYEVAVYTSAIDLSGNFTIVDQVDKTNLVEIQYDRAFVTVGITDLRGISENILCRWDGMPLEAKPGSRIQDVVASGVTFELPDLRMKQDSVIAFGLSIQLQGSENMSFIPAGKTTNVSLGSTWSAPHFNGSFLPDERTVTDSGFLAKWKVLQLNRNFPQSWVSPGQTYDLMQSAFGVDLILPLDDYQKSTRSIKYAIMTIALTFLIFFLVEILSHRRIHPFQYALVGLALVLFYVLLVSISEHTNFNFAYLISFLIVGAMIGLYSTYIFRSFRLTILLVLAMAASYAFVFVTLQLTDYALLMGSIGLAMILALTMYFTRKIDWYKLKIAEQRA